MSDFATEYIRVKGNIEDAYTQAALKGATLPVNQNSDNLPSTIATITGGISKTTAILKNSQITVSSTTASGYTWSKWANTSDSSSYNTNQTFTYTSTATTDITAITNANNYNLTADANGGTIMPSGYKQLDYIKSTGTQYINLGLPPTTNTEVELTFKTTTFGKWIFGSRSTWGAADTLAIYIQSKTIVWPQITNDDSKTKQPVANYNDAITTIKLNKDYFYFNNVNTNSTAFGHTSLSSTNNMYLFGLNHGSSLESRIFTGNMYSCKIWESNVLVRNLIPCIQSGTNAVGMYDIVNGVFYANSGTGTFVAGNNIGWTMSGSTATKTVTYNQPYGTLPTLTRTGYTFNGWFTASTGGTQVTSSTTYTTAGNSTIYAHWTINTYNVTYNYSENGGTKVTITIKKDSALWNDSGMNISLYSGTTSAYTTSTQSGATMVFSGVASGTYRIYAQKSTNSGTELTDSGIDVVVTNNGASSGSATIDYYTLITSKGTGISDIALLNGGGDGASLEKYYVTQVINGDECELQLTSTNPNNSSDELLVGQYVVDSNKCKLYLMEE